MSLSLFFQNEIFFIREKMKAMELELEKEGEREIARAPTTVGQSRPHQGTLINAPRLWKYLSNPFLMQCYQ
jgi:hypothetical protein